MNFVFCIYPKPPPAQRKDNRHEIWKIVLFGYLLGRINEDMQTFFRCSVKKDGVLSEYTLVNLSIDYVNHH